MISYIFVSQTEDIGSSDGYEYGDPLTIYDGSNEQSIQIAKLNGNLGSFGISSPGNNLFVKFESDHNIAKDGFFATIHYGNSYFKIVLFKLKFNILPLL